MKTRIIVDSTADLMPEFKSRVHTVPLTLRFGDEEYIDSVTIDHKTFYEKLIESDILPTTSQATPDAFIKEFEKAKKVGEAAVVITLSSNFSGTYQSALIAAEDYENIFIVDSGSAAMGSGILVELAFEMLDQGKSAEEIARALEEEKKKIVIVALVDTLEYLKKGGRISSAVAFAGTLLSIKPIVGIRNSELSMISKARGMRNGGRRLMELIRQGKGINFEKPFVLAHTGLSDPPLRKFLEDFSEMIESKVEMQPLCRIGSTIGAHAGPGAIGLAYFEKE